MAVSYLSLLQQIRQQPDLIQRLGSGIGQFAQASIADARERAKLEQANIQSMLSAGQTREAAQRVANLRQDLRTGYGMELPAGPVRGTSVMAPLQGPSVPPSMRAGMRPELATPEFFQRKVGESFETPEAKRAVYAGAMLKAPEPEYIRVGDAIYDKTNNRWIEAPAEMRETKMGFVRRPDGSEVYTALTPGTVSAPVPRAAGGGRERAPRLISVYNAKTGKMEVRQMLPGMQYDVSPYSGGYEDEAGVWHPALFQRGAAPAGTAPAPPPSRRPTQTDLTPAQQGQVDKRADNIALKLFPEAGGTKQGLDILLATKPEAKAQYDAILEAETARAQRAVIPSKGGKPAAAPEETAAKQLIRAFQEEERIREEKRRRRQAEQNRK